MVHAEEFKRSTDVDEGFVELKEAEANERHKSIISALGSRFLHSLTNAMLEPL